MNDQVLIMNRDDLEFLLNELLSKATPSKEPDKWILESEAMKMLGIKSKSHLWKLRTEGCIAYTQPSRKHILYDRDSILEYLETHKKHTF